MAAEKILSYRLPMQKQWATILREAILASGMSAGELWKLSGVSQPTITEFLRGKDIRLSTAEKIAAHVGVELKQRPGKK